MDTNKIILTSEPLTLLASGIIGLISGIFTGLIPGIHPNTVIFTSVPFYLSSGTSIGLYTVFITTLSVTHTFCDFLPAIFISSPDAESALAVINGRSAVEQGKGLEMFQYTVFGGLLSLIPVLFISGLSLIYLEQAYTYLESLMPYILLFFLFFIVFDSKQRFNSFLVVLFAGALGVISFETNVNQSYVFIPLFSGLFAFPAVLRSIKEDFKVPEQDDPEVDKFSAFKGSLAGSFAGFIAGVIPGVGGAVSTTFVSPLMDLSNRRFISALGAVNTTDIIFSLITLHLLGNARSGVSVALQFFSTEINLFFLILVTLLAVLPSAFLAIKISKIYVDLLNRFPLKIVLSAVLVFLVGITLYMTGFTGLIVLMTSALIGEASLEIGNRKACMAVLIVPAIIFFTGIGAFI